MFRWFLFYLLPAFSRALRRHVCCAELCSVESGTRSWHRESHAILSMGSGASSQRKASSHRVDFFQLSSARRMINRELTRPTATGMCFVVLHRPRIECLCVSVCVHKTPRRTNCPTAFFLCLPAFWCLDLGSSGCFCDCILLRYPPVAMPPFFGTPRREGSHF